MDKFDTVTLAALEIAQSEALSRRHSEIGPYHLMFGLLENPNSRSAKLFKNHRDQIAAKLAALASLEHPVPLDALHINAGLNEWLTLAKSKSTKEGRQSINEVDLLYFVHKFVAEIKLSDKDAKELSQEIKELPFLTNLNELANQGKLDPVVGRTQEIRSVIEILGRRSKNNPVLIGSAGVGKTAIVEGLAEQIAKENVPDVLLGKTVYSLDMGSLMAGTKFRGDFEERIQQLLKFMQAQAGQAILFIDEIHQLIGAGRTDGAMDAANLLKPALARGDLHCIGATTPDEYQKYILNDSALERRFRPVRVEEPSIEDATEILLGVRDKHEMHHGIKISDEAIYAAVKLSVQYLTDKRLPDKAIDLIDEAASSLKLSAQAMPADLALLEAEIRAKKILAQFEKDNSDIQDEIVRMQKEFDVGKEHWAQEVKSLKRLTSVKNALEKATFDLEKAEREGRFEDASKIKYGVVPDLQKELASHQSNWILTPEHIAKVIARHTGIKVEKILKDKQEKLLELEDFLKSRVYGQDEALHEISETLITAYAGLTAENRPMGSFLLKGPTGVGKTETVKALATFLFDSEQNMVRLDMSEYSEKHAVAKLIGAPAGYVGYEDAGVLTEAIRRKPYAVLLFDELEKAHPDFADILLQILDEGRLSDNKGRTIDFRNTIVMMTTNSKNLNQDFKPEVLGRIDSILTYKTLNQDVTKKLVDKQLANLANRLKGKNIKISLSEAMISELCKLGYDPQFGARPMQNVFNRLIARPLATQIIAGNLSKGDLMADFVDNQTVWRQS